MGIKDMKYEEAGPGRYRRRSPAGIAVALLVIGAFFFFFVRYM